MTLAPGTTLGPYAVTAKIGEGGMGEVYRARDTKLDRDVALKVLPQAFTDDPDRLARFEREAKVLASLNHPNIGGIHGLEESEGVRALVLEYIEGPTLADRIAQGPIPVDEALPIAKQIAEALEAAHEAGVIHRDLKPANIKVRPDGTVKVLDFGLAKALDPSPETDPSQSPTLTAAATQMGVIMGTAAYMSPEQARGKPVDKRADIWAFGVVLLEMLTGRKVFEGEDVSLTLSSVLQREPDWSHLPPDVSPSLSVFLHCCLEKDPKQRIPDVAAMRLAIEGAFETAVTAVAEPSAVPPLRFWQRPLPATLAALGLIIATALVVWSTSRPTDAPQLSITRFTLDIGQTSSIGTAPMHAMLALSPDGTQLSYAARLAGTDEARLYLRPLDGLKAQQLAHTGWIWEPFFSPDGESIGFFDTSLRELKRVSVQGGPPQTLAEVARGGATWLPDGTIIFPVPGRNLTRIPETGGTPEPLTTLDAEEESHRRPHALPGGTQVLFTTVSDTETPRVAVLSLETRERHIVVEDGYDARYVATGHVIFGRGGALWGVPFDLDRLDTAGSEQLLLPDVSGVDLFAMALVTSDDGTLVYLSTSAESGNASSLVWVNRQGQRERIPMAPDTAYSSPTVLPGGDGIAYVVTDTSGRVSNWTLDLKTNVPPQLSIGGTQSPARWSPDGRRFVVAKFDGSSNIHLGSADSSDTSQLTATDQRSVGPSWSGDGEWVVFTAATAAISDRDIWVVRPDSSEEPRPLIATPAEETQATVSPNGRWIAYRSDRSGQHEILVEPFPSGGEPTRVSASGGTEPVWSKDSHELYYRADDHLMAVPVGDGSEFQNSPPIPLFEDRSARGIGPPGTGATSTYDVAPDGRFLMVEQAEGDSTSFVVVLNWFEELKRLVPTE